MVRISLNPRIEGWALPGCCSTVGAVVVDVEFLRFVFSTDYPLTPPRPSKAIPLARLLLLAIRRALSRAYRIQVSR